MTRTGANKNMSPGNGLLVVLPSLRAGGAERSLVSLALQLCSHFPVQMAVVRAIGDLHREVGSSLIIHDLGGRATAVPRFIWQVWRQKPAIILSTPWDINLLVLLCRPFLPRSTKIVVREAVMPSSLDQEARWPRLWRTLYRHLYRRADTIVVLTQEMKQELRTEFSIPDRLITVIQNAVQSDRCGAAARPRVTQNLPRQLVSMGRLVSQKGYDVLLRSFVQVIAKYPGTRLQIYGEGPDRTELQRLIDVLGLRSQVSLPGTASHPDEVFGCADLYVLSSRYEGMSNAMLEALCTGIPVVAVCRHTGATEVITDGFNGFLVSDCTEDEMAGGILRAIREYERLDREAIRDDARRRFSGVRLVEDYLKLFARLSQRLPVSGTEA